MTRKGFFLFFIGLFSGKMLPRVKNALTFTVHRANMDVIAYWIPQARKILDGFGPIESYVNKRLQGQVF